MTLLMSFELGELLERRTLSMEALSLLRTVGALGVVLGILAAGLWLARRFNLWLPGSSLGGPAQRVQLVERTTIDSRRSLVLVRRDGREHLLMIGPEETVIVGSSIIRDRSDAKAANALMAEAEARRIEVEEAMQRTRARVAALRSEAVQCMSQQSLRVALWHAHLLAERARQTFARP